MAHRRTEDCKSMRFAHYDRLCYNPQGYAPLLAGSLLPAIFYVGC